MDTIALRRTVVAAWLTAAGLALAACGGSGGGTSKEPGGTPAVGVTGGSGTGGGSVEYASAPIPAGLAGVGDLPAPASAWPAAGYDARHSSATTATGPSSGTVRWRHTLGGDATPGPVLAADGSVLAATNSGVLYDLDARTGAQIWRYDGGGSYGSDLTTSAAVLTGGTILWPGPKDTLYALSPKGVLLWSQKFAGQVLSPAVAGANRVYVSDLAGHLSALEITATAHRLVWTLNTHGTDYASATVGPDGTIYTVGGDGGKDLYAVRDLGGSGAVRWTFHAAKMLEVSDGVGPDGTVVVGSNAYVEYGITAAGKVVWSVRIGNYTYSSSVVRPDGRSYFGDNRGNLWQVDVADGAVTGPLNPAGVGKEHVWSSPVVDARGNVYWASTGGKVYGYSASGARLFALSVGAGVNSSPALGGDGTLYVTTTAGVIYAIAG